MEVQETVIISATKQALILFFYLLLIAVESSIILCNDSSLLFFLLCFLFMIFYSEEEARMKIYSVSTRCYFAFGALVSEELSLKIKGGLILPIWLISSVARDDEDFNLLKFVISELPRVRWVLPDSYLDVKNKDYGGMIIVGFWMRFFPSAV